jgi:hypothetical protein
VSYDWDSRSQVGALLGDVVPLGVAPAATKVVAGASWQPPSRLPKWQSLRGTVVGGVERTSDSGRTGIQIALLTYKSRAEFGGSATSNQR